MFFFPPAVHTKPSSLRSVTLGNQPTAQRQSNNRRSVVVWRTPVRLQHHHSGSWDLWRGDDSSLMEEDDIICIFLLSWMNAFLREFFSVFVTCYTNAVYWTEMMKRRRKSRCKMRNCSWFGVAFHELTTFYWLYCSTVVNNLSEILSHFFVPFSPKFGYLPGRDDENYLSLRCVKSAATSFWSAAHATVAYRTQRKELSTFFNIHGHNYANDWLVSLRYTGESMPFFISKEHGQFCSHGFQPKITLESLRFWSIKCFEGINKIIIWSF